MYCVAVCFRQKKCNGNTRIKIRHFFYMQQKKQDKRLNHEKKKYLLRTFVVSCNEACILVVNH